MKIIAKVTSNQFNQKMIKFHISYDQNLYTFDRTYSFDFETYAISPEFYEDHFTDFILAKLLNIEHIYNHVSSLWQNASYLREIIEEIEMGNLLVQIKD